MQLLITSTQVYFGICFVLCVTLSQLICDVNAQSSFLRKEGAPLRLKSSNQKKNEIVLSKDSIKNERINGDFLPDLYIIQFKQYETQNVLFQQFVDEYYSILHKINISMAQDHFHECAIRNDTSPTLEKFESNSKLLNYSIDENFRLIQRNSSIIQIYPETDFVTIQVARRCKYYFNAVSDYINTILSNRKSDNSINHENWIHKNPTIKTATSPKDTFDTINQVYTPDSYPSSLIRSIFEDRMVSLSPKDLRNSNMKQRSDLISMLNVEQIWKKGITGKGVHVAVFDTGISDYVKDKNHFEDIVETLVYTENEKTAHDELGHGTFVASVIAAKPENKCRGIAPGASLHIFKVFTKFHTSYTSWFLDAFNYILHAKINILNLSIGGPDYMDEPFIDKVLELTAQGVIFISAIGNDGPLFGTLNNPGDMASVIGVGALDIEGKIASFSSRGVSTQYLRRGYGRIKPDLVTFGQYVPGLHSRGGCQRLSGTSVSSPVVTGVVTLLASAVPEESRFPFLNPSSMKQILQEGCERLPDASIYEQGSGSLSLTKAYDALLNYSPKITFFPSKLDLTDCPYMWPHCAQPIYYSSMPLLLNVTILNGISSNAKIKSCQYFSEGKVILKVTLAYDEVLWPYSGWLGIHINVAKSARYFDGIANGNIQCTFMIPPISDAVEHSEIKVTLPIRVRVIRTPLRERRVLWDQYHSIQYPPGYIPRDNLNIKDDILDWNGDHLHTNFRDLFNHLRMKNYFVEVLNGDLTSFNPSNYGSLLIVDPEEEFSFKEREALTKAVQEKGLGLIIFADWYNNEVLEKIIFFDESTRSKWIPVTGGSNLPALNGLLDPFGIAFGDRVFEGTFAFGKGRGGPYLSGTSIAKFPSKSLIGYASLKDQTASIVHNRNHVEKKVPIFGLTTYGFGRISVFGDSNCLDSSHLASSSFCFNFLEGILQFINRIVESPHVDMRLSMTYIDLPQGFVGSGVRLPQPGSTLIDKYSLVPKDQRVVTSLTIVDTKFDEPGLQKQIPSKIEGPVVFFIPIIGLLFLIITIFYLVYSQSKSTVYVMNPEIEMVQQV